MEEADFYGVPLNPCTAQRLVACIRLGPFNYSWRLAEGFPKLASGRAEIFHPPTWFAKPDKQTAVIDNFIMLN